MELRIQNVKGYFLSSKWRQICAASDILYWPSSHLYSYTIPLTHIPCVGCWVFLQIFMLKVTVSRDFLHPVFFINQFILVPLEMSMGRFIFLLFHRVIALLKRLPGTLETGESLPFYLDLELGLHVSILKLLI